jgi:hypothetical protein
MMEKKGIGRGGMEKGEVLYVCVCVCVCIHTLLNIGNSSMYVCGGPFF